MPAASRMQRYDLGPEFREPREPSSPGLLYVSPSLLRLLPGCNCHRALGEGAGTGRALKLLALDGVARGIGEGEAMSLSSLP